MNADPNQDAYLDPDASLDPGQIFFVALTQNLFVEVIFTTVFSKVTTLKFVQKVSVH